MSATALIASAAGLTAAAGVVELAGVFAASRARRAAARPPTVGAGVVRPGGHATWSVLAAGPAAGAVRALASVGRRIARPAAPADLATRLAAAGRPLGLSVADLMAVKAGGALVALLAGAPLALALPGRLPVVALPALPIAGFWAPDGALARRARRRVGTMETELPDLLDLLRVAVQAGLALDRALAEVADRHQGLLAREWRVAATELALGVPRERALRDLLGRCPAPGMGAVIGALERAERHGAPLAETLAAQAREARANRARRIRDGAAKAAPKIQLAVALLLVPAVLLLVGAALVAGLRG